MQRRNDQIYVLFFFDITYCTGRCIIAVYINYFYPWIYISGSETSQIRKVGLSNLVICGDFRSDLLSYVKTMLFMKKQIIIFIVLAIVIVLFTTNDSIAQCPMCKISAESNLRDGGSAGKGLNFGILYMFALPYLLVSTLGFLWFKNRKNYDNEDDSSQVV